MYNKIISDHTSVRIKFCTQYYTSLTNVRQDQGININFIKDTVYYFIIMDS